MSVRLRRVTLTAVTARITNLLPGVYSVEGFLDPSTGELIKSEMRESEYARARVYDREWNYQERATLRSTLQVEVSGATHALIRAKLLDMRPALSRHFELELSDCQELNFLIYKPGDFFEPHKDASERPGAPEHVRQRRVSVIVFLSDEDDIGQPGEYSGGSLGFYGLLKDPRAANIGLPVKGKAGLLVTFRSDVFHQVSTVTRGERYSIVSWFV
ncbi:MAG TPA: 2OG-Fe(II) oxygenase [Pyrinomonadaceae bacterium]